MAALTNKKQINMEDCMCRLLKKCLAGVLVLCVSITSMPAVYARSPEARNISIFRLDGQYVSLARAPGGREIEPRAGQRLVEGNILSTGWDSQVYLQLDDTSILKMDESSRVQVGAARSLLSLTVQSGSALVDVLAQSPGHAMETRIGNTSLAVRGTLYIMSRRDADVVTITMLSGSGEVTMRGDDGLMTQMPLPAGFMMWVYDVFDDAATDGREIALQAYRISLLDVNEMNLFELLEIINRQEYLLEAGVLTEEMIEDAFLAVEARIIERDAIREIYIAGGEEEVETERILMPADEAERAANVPESSPANEPLGNGNTLPPPPLPPLLPPLQPPLPPPPEYITIRGVRISTDLEELQLNMYVGGGGLAFDFTDEEIAPLRYMVNLQSLTITRSYVSDLTPLAGLVNLTDLRLSDNYRLTNLTPIASLVNLTSLQLQDNRITDIGPLASLTGLRSLNLNNNSINNIEPIRDLTELQELRLNRNYVHDLAPLSNLTRLAHLDLLENEIEVLAGLENLRNLTYLVLAVNNIENVSPLRNLSYLTRLDLWRNRIIDIEPLASLTNLTFLSLGDNNISEITHLGSLVNLEELFLDSNQIMEISPLANLAALRLLNLWGNPGIDVWDWSYVDHVTVVIGRFMHGFGFGSFLPGNFAILSELCDYDDDDDEADEQDYDETRYGETDETQCYESVASSECDASGTYYCYEEYSLEYYGPEDYDDEEGSRGGGKYDCCKAITKEDDEDEHNNDYDFEDDEDDDDEDFG